MQGINGQSNLSNVPLYYIGVCTIREYFNSSDQGKVKKNTCIKLMLFMMASNVSQLSHNMIINAFIKALNTLAISPVCDGLGVSVMRAIIVGHLNSTNTLTIHFRATLT